MGVFSKYRGIDYLICVNTINYPYYKLFNKGERYTCLLSNDEMILTLNDMYFYSVFKTDMQILNNFQTPAEYRVTKIENLM